jgi:hypothetical protein
MKDDGPYEDVPLHLLEPLRQWIQDAFGGSLVHPPTLKAAHGSRRHFVTAASPGALVSRSQSTACCKGLGANLM